MRVDFVDGGVFNGTAYWLAVSVRTNDPTDLKTYARLEPLQRLSPTPYSLFANNAPWSGLIGVPAGFADGVDNEGAAAYTAGPGLKLVDSRFEANLDGACVAPELARKDHTHPAGPGSGLDADLVDGKHAGDFWQLRGNAIVSGEFLGTLNNESLVLQVNSVPAFRLQPTLGNPNVIGGASQTVIESSGATISGGSANTISSNSYATIGGGFFNKIDSWARNGVIGGGDNNTIAVNAQNVLIAVPDRCCSGPPRGGEPEYGFEDVGLCSPYKKVRPGVVES